MSDKKWEVNFHFGKRYVSPFKVYLTAAALQITVDLLKRFFGLSPQLLWELISIIGHDYKIGLINDIIIQVPELLQDRIRRDIDDALEDVKDDFPTPPFPDPEWINVEEGETPLGGEIGFSYDFVVDLEEKKNEQD